MTREISPTTSCQRRTWRCGGWRIDTERL
jgi:hypothetical protein